MVEELKMPLKSEQEHENIYRICFVCTGNTCRSPMAAAVTNAMAQDKEKGGGLPLIAESRGLYADIGAPISAGARRALESADIKPVEGLDYRKHRAQNLMREEMDRFDLLVGLGDGHVMELLMRFPEAATKITRMPTPIADPYGGDDACYRACLAEILKGVKALLFREESDEA